MIGIRLKHKNQTITKIEFIKNKENPINEKLELKNKEQFITLMKKYGIISTYDKETIDEKYNPKYTTWIIDATKTEPYIVNNEYIIDTYAKEIIKLIYELMKILKIKETYIAITSGNHHLKEKMITLSDKYKYIHIIEVLNIYPINNSFNLSRYIKHKEKDEKIIIENSETIYQIKNAIENVPFTTKFITVYLDKPYILKVPFETKIKEILKVLKIKNDYCIYENGPLHGKIKKSSDKITYSTECLYLEKKHNIKEYPCIKCGKCISNCPMKLNPIYAKNNHKKLEKCNGCGICTYVCPAYIDLKKEVYKENDK